MKRNAILHGVTALCSALVYAFFALPFMSTSNSLATASVSGYKYLDTYLPHMDLIPSNQKFAAVAGLLLLLVAGLTLVASVVLLLCDLEVIKNEMVAKVATWATLVLAGLLVVVAIMNLVGNIIAVNEMIDAAGAGAAGVKIQAGWAMTIITTLLALGACGTTAYAHFKK